MAYIYKIVNDINNKIYIGLTRRQDPYQRWKEHLKNYKNEVQQSKRPLYEAMIKYGIEHFSFEIIEETDYPEQREQYWIAELRTYIGFSDSKGYNNTLGGDGVFKNTFENGEKEYIIELFKEGMSCATIAEETEHSEATISQLLKDNNYELKSYKGNKVIQYDLENNLINTFESAKQAAEALGKKGKGGHITEVCNGIRKTAYGFKWSYSS